MDWILNILITSAGFGLFALVHSVLAHRHLKQRLFAKWPSIEPVYRIVYTVISVLTLGAWYFFSPFPEGVLYRIPSPASWFFRTVQVAGVAGFLLSLTTIDMMKFIGLKQHQNREEENGGEELVTEGVYRWIRHPLYTATMMILLFNPLMSQKLALINLLFGLYIWIGSIYEERNLLEQYGDAYKKYRKDVPRFIPKIHLF